MQHLCHWPGCKTRVPPKMWGCRKHWYTLPKILRTAVWQAYRPGQEIDKQPSKTYLDVANKVHQWCIEYIKKQRATEETNMSTWDELLAKPKPVSQPEQPAQSTKPAFAFNSTNPTNPTNNANPFAALQQTIQQAPAVQPSPVPPATAIEHALAQDFNFPGQGEAMEEQAAEQMRGMFTQLYESLGGDKISENLSRVLKHIHEHPFLRDALQEDDIHLISKAVQASSGFVIQKKTERKAKTTKKKVEDQALEDALLSGLTMGGSG